MDTLSEVRAAIDEIDEQLVRLLSARLRAVKRAAELKGAANEARVPGVSRRWRDGSAMRRRQTGSTPMWRRKSGGQ